MAVYTTLYCRDDTDSPIDLCKPINPPQHGNSAANIQQNTPISTLFGSKHGDPVPPPETVYDAYVELFDDEPLPQHVVSPPDAENLIQPANDCIWEAALVHVETPLPSL